MSEPDTTAAEVVANEELPEGMMGDSGLERPGTVHLVGAESVEEDDLAVFVISEQVAKNVFQLLQDSCIVNCLARLSYGKANARFEREDFDDETVGTVLQGVYLNTKALLEGKHPETPELEESDKVGILIEQCTERIQIMLNLLPFGPNLAETLISSFDEQLAQEKIAPTDSLVGQILQQVWSKLGRKINVRR